MRPSIELGFLFFLALLDLPCLRGTSLAGFSSRSPCFYSCYSDRKWLGGCSEGDQKRHWPGAVAGGKIDRKSIALWR